MRNQHASKSCSLSNSQPPTTVRRPRMGIQQDISCSIDNICAIARSHHYKSDFRISDEWMMLRWGSILSTSGIPKICHKLLSFSLILT